MTSKEIGMPVNVLNTPVTNDELVNIRIAMEEAKIDKILKDLKDEVADLQAEQKILSDQKQSIQKAESEKAKQTVAYKNLAKGLAAINMDAPEISIGQVMRKLKKGERCSQNISATGWKFFAHIQYQQRAKRMPKPLRVCAFTKPYLKATNRLKEIESILSKLCRKLNIAHDKKQEIPAISRKIKASFTIENLQRTEKGRKILASISRVNPIKVIEDSVSKGKK